MFFIKKKNSIRAINSNISNKIKIITTYSTTWVGTKLTGYQGKIFTVNISVPSGYSVYNIDTNIYGITSIKGGFDSIDDITRSNANVYVMNISEYEQTIPSNARIIVTSILVKN